MRVHVTLKVVCTTGFAILLGSGTVTATAADWQFNPKIEAGMEANDNYRLFPSGSADHLYGGFTTAAFQFRYLDSLDDFSITPAVYASYLPDSTADNTTDPSMTLNWLRTGQTYKAGLSGQYIRQSTVQADLTTASTIGNQLGNPVAGDSGYVTERVRQQLEQLSPTFTIDLTQRRHLELKADYYNVSYQPNTPGFNVGYNSFDGTVGLAQDLTQRSTATLRALITQFDPQGDFATTRSYGLEGQWDYRVSEISQAYLRVGAVRSFFEDLPGVAHVFPSTGVVVGGGVNWTFQVTQVFLDFTRTVEPNATGYSVNRDQVRLSLTRAFSATVNLIVAARYAHDAATTSTPNFSNRDYGLLSAGVKWRFLRAWTLSGEYDFTDQRYATVPPTNGRSNAILLSVIYEPNRVN